MVKMVVCARVGSRLDYANAVILRYHSEKKHLSKLRKTPCTCSSFQSISTNIIFLTLHSQSVYLHSALRATSIRSVRFSNTNLLSVPFVRTSFGAVLQFQAFSFAAPKI